MKINKFNINICKYDLTNNNEDYVITFINPNLNIGKNDIYQFIDNKKKFGYNKVCRRLINFKLYSIKLLKRNIRLINGNTFGIKFYKYEKE